MRLDLTPADVLRLKGLGVRVEPEPAERRIRTDDDIIIALNDRCASYYQALQLAVQGERRAWAQARRWRLWGWLGLACAMMSIVAQIVAAVAGRGGW